MPDETKSHEATWQHPEHKGRGGAANPPGDKGQDRKTKDGSPVERSGWSREERASGFAQIADRNAAEAASTDDPERPVSRPGTQVTGGGTQGLEQGPPPAESAEGESGV